MAWENQDNPNLSCSNTGVGRSTHIHKPGEMTSEHHSTTLSLENTGTCRLESEQVRQACCSLRNGVSSRCVVEWNTELVAVS